MASSNNSNAKRSSFGLRREIGGVVLIATALVVLLAIFSFTPEDVGLSDAEPSNLIGPAGVHIANALLSIFGIGAFFINALLWYFGISLLVGRPIEASFAEVVGQLLFVLSSTVLGHILLVDHTIFGHGAGGWIGEFSGETMRGIFGTVGTSIVSGSALIVGAVLVTGLRPGTVVRGGLGIVQRFFDWIRHRIEVRRRFKERFAEERQKLLAGEELSLSEEARREAERSLEPLLRSEDEWEDEIDEEVERKLAEQFIEIFGDKITEGSIDADNDGDDGADSSKTQDGDGDGGGGDDDSTNADGPSEMGELAETESEIEKNPIPIQGVKGDDSDQASGPDTIEVSDSQVVDMKSEAEPEEMLDGEDASFGPEIVESEAKQKAREKQEMLENEDDGMLFKPKRKGNFELPPISFLNFQREDDVTVDGDSLRAMAAEIEQTLADFRVEGSVVEICPGPVITMFEFEPAPGVKISKISNLSDDLAMALAAHSVRIVAPIPGKGVVGIEVPNKEREMVYLKEILADEQFVDDEEMSLPLALGKDTEGSPVIADLASMPHLLVAGATGSGKSVAVNSMICSLLYKHSPADLRMIMVDPKMLEFNVYEDIPHLLLPVVTDPKQATVALNWTVQEMERRYQALADMGARNIDGYNQRVEKYTKQAELDQLEGREESEAFEKLGLDADGEPDHEHMPHLVVVIDEFADLMMTASKDVEDSVARLAQKARAAGIHIILATQRPSTDVITGMIKANFPARIALRVTSRTDSRVVLDSNGAENLLGNGDMLFMPSGSSSLERAHGCYVSEDEITDIVQFLHEQGQPTYNEEILSGGDGGQSELPEQEKDEYYEQAVRLVVDQDRASISMLQRKLRVGYNRAARMVDMMERENLVGPSDGCKPRDVLVDKSPYEDD